MLTAALWPLESQHSQSRKRRFSSPCGPGQRRRAPMCTVGLAMFTTWWGVEGGGGCFPFERLFPVPVKSQSHLPTYILQPTNKCRLLSVTPALLPSSTKEDTLSFISHTCPLTFCDQRGHAVFSQSHLRIYLLLFAPVAITVMVD